VEEGALFGGGGPPAANQHYSKAERRCRVGRVREHQLREIEELTAKRESGELNQEETYRLRLLWLEYGPDIIAELREAWAENTRLREELKRLGIS
jgi:hypothetical protein